MSVYIRPWCPKPESVWMGLGGHKKALFINYLLQCNKEYLGFETLVEEVNFFCWVLLRNWISCLLLIRAKKDRMGIKKWSKRWQGRDIDKKYKWGKWTAKWKPEKRRIWKNTITKNESLSKIMNNGETQESLHCNKQPKASQTSNCKLFTDRMNLSYMQKFYVKPNTKTKLPINPEIKREMGQHFLVSVWNWLLGEVTLQYAWQSPYETNQAQVSTTNANQSSAV